MLKTILIIGLTTSVFAKAELIDSEEQWNQNCYTSFYSDATFLAGILATDCGFISPNSTEIEKHNTLNCVKEANISKHTFKFGVGWLGIDSMVCEAVVRDPLQRYWLIQFDSYSHRSPKDKKRPHVRVVSCNNFVFNATANGLIRAFEAENCEDSDETESLLKSIYNQKNQ